MGLNILSGGAAQGLVAALSAEFQAANRLEIAGTFGAIGAIKEKIIAGESADLVILSRGMIADLERDGLVVAGSAADIGVVLTGIAVREGDPIPDVANAAALRDALKAADAIYLPDPAKATAGVHFTKVLRQLGVAEAMTPRLKPYPHGHAAMTAMAAQRGGRPIGCTQATEILATPGVIYAGSLPHEFELATVYTAGVSTRAREPDGARQLAAMLAGSSARELRGRLGFGEV